MIGQHTTSRRTKSEVVALGEPIGEPGAVPRITKNNRQVRPQPAKLGDVFSASSAHSASAEGINQAGGKGDVK